ncbi:MAG: hypothetical protein AAF198_11840 [Pseudomonadota bacterium]
MTDQTAAALQVLIQQVTALTEKVDAQDKKYDDVYEMNADLLTKLKGPKDPDAPKTPTAADYAALLKKLETPKIEAPYRKEGDPVQITRTEALDPFKYTQAQNLAKEQNVQLEIVDDREGAGEPIPQHAKKDVDTSAIDMLEDTAQKVRYVRHDIAMGGQGFVQNSMAAERDGYTLRTFKDATDLPQHMAQKLDLMARAAEAQNAQADK